MLECLIFLEFLFFFPLKIRDIACYLFPDVIRPEQPNKNTSGSGTPHSCVACRMSLALRRAPRGDACLASCTV